EYPKPHYLGTYPAGADRGLGDHLGRDAYCLFPVFGGRHQRRRRRLPRQALPYGERARRLSRSLGRQGADRLDLYFARHRRRAADLPRHPRRLARHHDHLSLHAVLASKLMMALVAVLTLLSIAFYLAEWVRHMNSFGAGH